MKRIFDITSSLLVLLLIFPLFFILGLWIVLDSSGGIFYKQIRVGRDNKEFGLYKFRTMAVGSDKKGKLRLVTMIVELPR